DTAENAPVMGPLEYFQDHRAHDRGQPVAQRTLREDHKIDERKAWSVFQCNQRCKADCKAQTARRPDRLATDTVADMAECDLAGDAEQANDAEGPDADTGAESAIQKIFGLVNLHRIPDVKPAEIAERDPPEPRRAQRTSERPVGAGPDRIENVRY